MDRHLLISVKEARKLLGKYGKKLTDEQVEQMTILLEVIACEFIMDGSKIQQQQI